MNSSYNRTILGKFGQEKLGNLHRQMFHVHLLLL